MLVSVPLPADPYPSADTGPLGNFDRGDAAGFLKTFADVLGPGDTMLIGLDACADPARV